MIYSEEKKFIFIKSNKTGGTSVEIALSRSVFHHSRSIVTPISPEDELIRVRLGGASPQNCYADPVWSPLKRPRPLLASYYHVLRGLPGFVSGLSEFLVGKRSAEGFAEKAFEYRHALMRPLLSYKNHIHASAARALLGDPLFFSCYRFGFTRDPMQRALSHYTWNQFEEPDFSRRSLEDHRRSFCEHIQTRYTSAAKFFCDPVTKEIIVSDVFRYEDLETALKRVCRHLDLDVSLILPLPRAKVQYGQSVLPFPRGELIDRQAKALVRDRCRWEYDNFDYD